VYGLVLKPVRDLELPQYCKTTAKLLPLPAIVCHLSWIFSRRWCRRRSI